MKRIHAFEIEDLSGCPGLLREAGMAYLRFASEHMGQAKRIRPVIEDALKRAGEEEMVDLCSGGGGPALAITQALRAADCDVRLTLTDVFPSPGARRVVESRGIPGVRYEMDSVDATQVPAECVGLRTVFNAFHHFRPAAAAGILADAVRARQPIAIVEVLQRNLLATLAMFFVVPLSVLLLVPFLRPFRIAWIPLTYLIPVIPLFVLWDGVISSLRAYNPKELRALACEADPAGQFEWRVSDISMPPQPIPGVALIGIPKTRLSGQREAPA